MDLQVLTKFFMWCTILNGAMLALWSVMWLAARNLIYNTHSKWFPIPRETFNVTMYLFLGIYKIVTIVFSAVPFVALLIIT